MIMQEGMPPSAASESGRQLFAAAYFLDSLGDSHKGLGQHEAAIEAHRQAAEGFRAQGAQCSYALCLFKVATSHLALGEPWHAVGYLEACLPLLSDLGLTRHEGLARHELDACHAELAGAHLLGEGRASARRASARRGRPAPALLACRSIGPVADFRPRPTSSHRLGRANGGCASFAQR